MYWITHWRFLISAHFSPEWQGVPKHITAGLSRTYIFPWFPSKCALLYFKSVTYENDVLSWIAAWIAADVLCLNCSRHWELSHVIIYFLSCNYCPGLERKNCLWTKGICFIVTGPLSAVELAGDLHHYVLKLIKTQGMPIRDRVVSCFINDPRWMDATYFRPYLFCVLFFHWKLWVKWRFWVKISSYDLIFIIPYLDISKLQDINGC